MDESAEGMGGRKWSLLRDGDGVWLMEGKTKLAILTADGEKVLHLLVTAPQLWDAANALLLACRTAETLPLTNTAEKAARLGNAIAKAVNKTSWNDVKQA